MRPKGCGKESKSRQDRTRNICVFQGPFQATFCLQNAGFGGMFLGSPFHDFGALGLLFRARGSFCHPGGCEGTIFNTFSISQGRWGFIFAHFFTRVRDDRLIDSLID